MRWIVDYENSNGDLTTTELSDISRSEHFGPDSVNAYCGTRNERRSFNIERFLRIVDADTGEIVNDPRPLLGLPPRPPIFVPPARTPLLHPPPASGRRSQYSTETYKGQRNAEKRALRKYYVQEVIYEHFRQRVFAQFGYKCARCGARSAKLEWDHHYPMILGGHLAPGNIVPLCRPCNQAKHDADPADFYSPGDLARIEALLVEQRTLMAFEWRVNRWYSSEQSRRRYLLEIGLDPDLVHEMFSDPQHPWYQGQRSQ
jgi:5-methylcytosine-specific restriction endonuclease McrA